MSNKSESVLNELNELDKVIRRTHGGIGMDDGVHVTIQFKTGFELFNTRAYHNYETWSGGYWVSGYGVTEAAEDLDDAVKLWAAAVEKSGAAKKARAS